ncbi:potassium-transporting ATPase subunit C [Enterococcus sp. AZ163]|uniref:potassium-transporting ATPase subunit C n=1 Tax=Enterococcus sp. AZ163 TaxID=2774638 RepID=UPI003D292861
MKKLGASLRFLLFSLLIFGGLYTLLVTGVGQLLFPNQANGSVLEKNGKIVGSELIAQTFEGAGYFTGRSPEVSQLSPVSEKQKELLAARTNEAQKANSAVDVPNDLVTASGSGVDPHISFEAAEFQIPRIASERKLSEAAIHDIIEKNSQKDWFSDRKFVNVLALNLALDDQ